MAPTERAFTTIDGTPVYYWRLTWGSTQARTWYCTNAFYDQLVLWVRRLREVTSEAGYGSLSYLVSAGFYVNKTGQHGAGTAMDLDLLRFSGGTVISPIEQHHAGSQTVRRRYLAVDATCRTYFRFVLDGWYNAAHEDHIHSDLGGLPVRCVTSSESDVKFVQALCNAHMASGLAVDGVWGPLTQGAFDQARSRLGVSGNPHTDSAAWRSFLLAASRRGFADQAF